MTFEELRALFATAKVTLGNEGIILRGTVQDAENSVFEYEIREGSNPILANACDKEWDEFNIQLMDFIQNHVPPEKQATVLDQIQIDDAHWDWFAKAYFHQTDEYRWFFLTVANQPQGACLIYHPKPSVIAEGNIFYIEYLAVAPWNRKNPMREQRFHSVGRLLVKCAVKYAHEVLGLRYGFSLHSLPRAYEYYKKLGMAAHPASNKDVLAYFEMGEVGAARLAEPT